MKPKSPGQTAYELYYKLVDPICLIPRWQHLHKCHQQTWEKFSELSTKSFREEIAELKKEIELLYAEKAGADY